MTTEIGIFQGRRYRIVARGHTQVWLEPWVTRARRIEVCLDDRDLILQPTVDDLVLAEGFERGDIGAFEYADGRTYPPGQEIWSLNAVAPRRVH